MICERYALDLFTMSFVEFLQRVGINQGRIMKHELTSESVD